LTEITAGAADHGKRLDQFVQEHLPEFSRSRIQEWIRAARVLVDAREQKPSYTVRSGDRVAVSPAAAAPLRAEAEDIPLTILYEDESLVAIDKPAGMVVHAGAGNHSGTLVNALLHRFSQLSIAGGEDRPGIVHRLDRYTSGVLLVAKNDAAHRALAQQFASRQVRKTYLTLVHHAMKTSNGRIEKPIARDPVHRARMTARLATGRAAWTEWQVLESFPAFSYLQVLIGTGRTHQIRVHLSSIGHPVVGDRLYGAPAQVSDMPDLGRYFLHAHQIAFRHPINGTPLEITSPLAPELEQWLDRLHKV
jgi:23S rRNA pseudouridine1911/1915/1917 synthase